MSLRPLADLAELSRVVTQDDLPAPTRVEWWATSGLRVVLQPDEIDAWLKSAHGTVETAKAATETRSGGFVFYSLPRFLDEMPVTLAYHVECDEAAWRIHNTSSFSYANAAEFLRDWPTLTAEQQQSAWDEARWKYGVPSECLPELVAS